MIHSIDLADHDMIAMSRSTLAALRSILFRDAGPAAAGALQEAGYAGGEAVYESFRQWLRKQGKAAPEDLEVDEFQRRASTYFREAGWGTITVGSMGEALATVDSPDLGESEPGANLDQPGCHITTGMFADFFGRLSDVPLAVLEVECRSAGHERCRFLLGNAELLRSVYDEMENGRSYADAVAAVA
jgi:Predicted hydrocarbon binding protein (contains V4R domain)